MPFPQAAEEPGPSQDGFLRQVSSALRKQGEENWREKGIKDNLLISFFHTQSPSAGNRFGSGSCWNLCPLSFYLLFRALHLSLSEVRVEILIVKGEMEKNTQ